VTSPPGRRRRDHSAGDPRWSGASDEELLAATRQPGERERAFATLVDRFERRVYAICYRYFGNAADAEDATQETFVTVLARADRFRGESALSTWLYRVTVNTCHDLARRRARRPQTPVEDVVAASDGALRHAEIGWEPGDPAEAREVEAAVQRALLNLDDVSRVLVVLVALEELSYAEAAEIVGVPVGTAKSRVHRARARLALELSGNLPGSSFVGPE
jgi:RNA polymerase sigma-70 factor, ECF subfamily